LINTMADSARNDPARPGTSRKSKQTERTARNGRLAESLRENLKKRKEQSRSRTPRV